VQCACAHYISTENDVHSFFNQYFKEVCPTCVCSKKHLLSDTKPTKNLAPDAAVFSRGNDISVLIYLWPKQMLNIGRFNDQSAEFKKLLPVDTYSYRYGVVAISKLCK
jgi:hypothetical protein